MVSYIGQDGTDAKISNLQMSLYHHDRHPSDIPVSLGDGLPTSIHWQRQLANFNCLEICKVLFMRSPMTLLGQTSRSGYGCIRINCRCKGKDSKLEVKNENRIFQLSREDKPEDKHMGKHSVKS